MVRLEPGTAVPVNELARLLRKHAATVVRWGSPRGVRGCRLRLTKIGGRNYVTAEDWAAFQAALNAHAAASEVSVQQDRASLDAQLDAAGI